MDTVNIRECPLQKIGEATVETAEENASSGRCLSGRLLGSE
jgi:hypothetical protein